MKRVLLFVMTNLAVVLVLSLVLNVVMNMFGLSSRSYGGIFVIALLFGFGGSFISLLISKWMAKRSVGAFVIEQAQNPQQQWLLDTVARQAQQAGIAMPEVAVYQAPEMNAFATGPSRNNSLVAVSTGLLDGMTKDEVEAVLAHEVSHIANGDMVTMTLIQGVLNTFVIFFARVIAMAIDNATRSNSEDGEGLGTFAYIGIVMVLELIGGVLASIIVMWFSRQREYRADAGAAKLTSKESMAAALQRLAGGRESTMEGSMMALGINGKQSFAELFMSHPPIEKRIAALRERN